MRLGLWLAAFVAFALGVATPGARAQDYPNRSITLVVPYAAGGGNDAMARIVADHMSRTLGQQIVIENRGGAGGTIATRAVAKAAPDGYTLVIGGTGTLAINPTLYSNVGYDPRKDFAPVGLIATSALVILVHPRVEANSVKELIALAKKEPGKLNYASAGPGSGIHLGTELFASVAGVKLTHVPYKGSAPALADLLGGQVDMMFDNLGVSLPHVKAGKLRALAVASTRRFRSLPEVPTLGETLPGFESVAWFGIVGPPKTPSAIAEKVAAGVAEALRVPDILRRLSELSADPLGMTPAETAAFMKQETARWGGVIRAAGIKLE
jgi:tripartite-type tricarboxylate transporter receptor subunit TctC